MNFRNSQKKNDEFTLIILGEGEFRKNLERLIKKNKVENKIYLYGHVNNIYKYFSK